MRNNAIANNLNANVANPFFVGNLNRADFPALVWADMNTNGFFTSPTIRRDRLLRPFPHMNGLNNHTDSTAFTKSHEFQASFEKRFAKGWNLNLGFTKMQLREADFYFNEFDTDRTERASNDGRPVRFTATGVYELPFGRGKQFLSSVNRATDLLLGGWQMAATYEYQPGALTDFGNRFYYGGDVDNVANVDRGLETWFNTADFERINARGPNSFHRRIFPTRIDSIRADSTNQWNANVSKNFVITERIKMQLRINALNLQNRSQFAQPNTDPFSTNFGRITSQTAATNRWMETQARITF